MGHEVYLYADETGNLDYAGSGKTGASDYFGFGTAVYYDDHGSQLMQGLRLRTKVTANAAVQDGLVSALQDGRGADLRPG